MPETPTKGLLPAKALADFDYTADGASPRPVTAGKSVDVAPHHYAGLVRAGMIEPSQSSKYDEQMEVGLAALDEPVRDRVARELAEREAARPKGKAVAVPKEG